MEGEVKSIKNYDSFAQTLRHISLAISIAISVTISVIIIIIIIIINK